MARSFDEVADRYEADLQRGLVLSGESRDFFARGRVEHLASRLRELGIGVSSVLDFGCGTGETCPLLQEALAARRVVGSDLSVESLVLARARLGGDGFEFLSADDVSKGGGFDLVYSNGTFHHIPPAERLGVMRRIHSWLRPGGLFALFENNPWNPGTRFVMRRIPFDRDAIVVSAPEARRLLGSAGFRPLRTDFLFVFPRALRWFRGLEVRLTRFPLGAQYVVLALR